MQIFLAQAGGSANPWGGVEFWKVIGGLAGILTVWWLTLQIWGKYQRNPSMDAHFATKEELRAGLASVQKAGDQRGIEIKDDIADLTRSTTTRLASLEASMGREMTAVGRELKEQNSMMMSVQRQLGELVGEMRSRKNTPRS